MAEFRLVAPPPLLLGCLPCRVTGITGRLLFSLKQRFSLCFLGRVTGSLFRCHAFSIRCCLRCELGLLRSVALLAQPCFLALQRADCSRGGDGLALLSFLDGRRPF